MAKKDTTKKDKLKLTSWDELRKKRPLDEDRVAFIERLMEAEMCAFVSCGRSEASR